MTSMGSVASKDTIVKIVKSWATTENPFNSTDDLKLWIENRNKSVVVNVNKIRDGFHGDWYYDKNKKGIVNKTGSFFSITGIQQIIEDKEICSQPIYIQDEIGILGIVAKEINGVIYFLMQAKIEPGNINKIQISPTVQATKSNFMRVHGGKSPAYLDLFLNEKKHTVIVDQIQSEQSSRFLGKRNRNIIILVEEEIKLTDNFRWMTLGQIKQLMKIDNLVNMDTRTVISCIPFSIYHFNKKDLSELKKLFNDKALFNSMFDGDYTAGLSKVFQRINYIKMNDKSDINIVDLFSLKDWQMKNGEFVSEKSDFKIIYCDIEIEGREVRRWTQPLFEAVSNSIFGLIYCINDGKIEFLVRTKTEIGCFDKVEIGPSVQMSSMDFTTKDCVTDLFDSKIDKREGIIIDNLFSEEGGRFYREQNRNVLMRIDKKDINKLPADYFWIDYFTLNHLIQFNNILNIQLRNLLSTIEL